MFTVNFQRGRKRLRLHKSSVNKLAAVRDLFLHAGTDLHPDAAHLVALLEGIIEANEREALPEVHPGMLRFPPAETVA